MFCKDLHYQILITTHPVAYVMMHADGWTGGNDLSSVQFSPVQA